MSRVTLFRRVLTYRAISVALTITYIIVWVLISLDRFYAMKANVRDLGLVANMIESMRYRNWTSETILSQFSYQGILFVIAPLSLVDSVPTVIVFQCILLGLPAYILFEISFLETKSSVTSVFVTLAYVLYFPLAGANWFDVQIMNFFIFFFLLGYYLLLREKYVAGLIIILLSGTVRFPLMILVVVSSFSLLLPTIISWLKQNLKELTKYEVSVLVLFLLSSFTLVFQYVWLRTSSPSFIVTHSSSNLNPLLDLNYKIYTVILLLGPLLFLPLFSKKWVLPCMVFFSAVFFFNNPIYEYPSLFSNWYSVTLIPFAFLGVIDAVSHFTNDRRVKSTSQSIFLFLKFKLSGIHFYRERITLVIAIILLGMSLFLQPYGPLNQYSFNNFNLQENTKSNSTLFEAANTIINLVPQNESYVVVQNDLPQFFPRRSIEVVMVPPYGIGPNITRHDLLENSFPYNGASMSTSVCINYTITDINDLHSLSELSGTPGYPTMIQLDQILLNSSLYGIVAEDHGIILIKRGYSGPPNVIEPYNTSVDLNQMIITNGSIDNGQVYIEGPFNQSAVERTPFVTLFPGRFEFKVSGALYNANDTSIWLEDGYYISASHFIFLNKTVWNINAHSDFQKFTLFVSFKLPYFVGNAQCFIVPLNLSGTMLIKSITMTQIA